MSATLMLLLILLGWCVVSIGVGLVCGWMFDDGHDDGHDED